MPTPTSQAGPPTDITKSSEAVEDSKEIDESSTISQTDPPLEGKVICLDPGHQAKMYWEKVPIAPEASHMMPDYSVGTKGIESGEYEYRITLKVARKISRRLIRLGADVILTRNSEDEAIGNLRRAELANEANADIAVRLHCDGIEDSSIHGLSVLYPGDKYIKDKEMLEKSLELSKAVLKSASSSVNTKSRGMGKRNDLIVFNYSKVPSTLIEMGFLTNLEEDRLLNSEDYQEKLAEGITQGIIDYFLSMDLKGD